jgi:hypothetical protein
MKASLTGGSPVTFASGQNTPDRIALDTNNIYWLNWGTDNMTSNTKGSVMKLKLTGGRPLPLPPTRYILTTLQLTPLQSTGRRWSVI